MSDEEVCCEWCGGEVWDASELQNGKCLLCVVQDCRHFNRVMIVTITIEMLQVMTYKSIQDI